MTLTTLGGRPYGHIAQIIANRLYFGSFYEIPKNDEETVHFCIDEQVTYHPFYDDFGPLNLSELYRACQLIRGLLKTNSRRKIVVCTDNKDTNRVNGAFLVASYMVIYEGLTADQAYLRVQRAEPPAFVGFTDASLGEPSYLLHLQHTIKAVEKALKLNWLDFDNFDRENYEFYERVENGDLNWIIPGKVLSFCGPHDRSYIHNGYPYHSPQVYFDFFRKNSVDTIIRLNTKLYDRKKFIDAGFNHFDLFFVDGSTPSDQIVERFFNILDNAKGGVAVHCKAGLGRTGTLIACWMMKEYRLTAPQCIAWLRICRPGSVIGPQQQYLIEKQSWCWRYGVQQHQRNRSPKRPIDDNKKTEEYTIDVLKPSTPAIIRQHKNENTFDETAINEKGQSQGDRLNEMKLRSQHNDKHYGQFVKPSTTYNEFNDPPTPLSSARSQSAAAFRQIPTATTPIKQLKLSTAPRPYLPTLSGAIQSTEIGARRQLNLRMPISKVIVHQNRTTTTSKSSTKNIRLQPYSTTNINTIVKYGLRPRKNLVSPVRFDPSYSPTTSPENNILQRQHHSSSAILNSYTRNFRS